MSTTPLRGVQVRRRFDIWANYSDSRPPVQIGYNTSASDALMLVRACLDTEVTSFTLKVRDA